MNYSDIRSTINSGDVLAWSVDGWNSLTKIKRQIIRIVTRSEFYHVGIAWVISGRVFVVEAISNGVTITPLSNCNDFYLIPTDVNWSLSLERKMLKEVNEPYSVFEAIISSMFKIAVGANDSWECAEFVQYVLQLSNINIDVKSTPGAVVQVLLVRGHMINFVKNVEV